MISKQIFVDVYQTT